MDHYVQKVIISDRLSFQLQLGLCEQDLNQLYFAFHDILKAKEFENIAFPCF